MNTTTNTGVASDERTKFNAWLEKRGVWPRLTYFEIWQAALATTAPQADAAPSADAESRPPMVKVPTDILEARAQGRAEALAIILGLDAETGLDECTHSYSIGDTGDYGVGWDEDKLRELLRADDSAWSLMQEAEGEYWHNLGLRDDAEILIKELQEQRAAIAAGGAQETAAARDVLAERQRQVTAEGWTPEHDDDHTEAEMALAAACYAMAAGGYAKGQTPPIWPWSLSWWKPAYGRRDLIKAGALILAEIERIDRATPAASNGEQGVGS